MSDNVTPTNSSLAKAAAGFDQPSRLGLQVLYRLHKLVTLYSRHRSFAAFCFVLVAIAALDLGFDLVVFPGLAQMLRPLFPTALISQSLFDLSFAPEVWLSVLGLALGTLIIVISIAAQNIPKLVDVYMQDWISLLYIWFLILAGAHAVFIKLYGEMIAARISSILLNVYILFPLAVLLTLPYIFYILKCTQPNTVIDRITYSHRKDILSLPGRYTRQLLEVDLFLKEKHSDLFVSLNQLDNLLEYVPLKEAKAKIIQDLGRLLQEYILVKPLIHPRLFKVSSEVKSDISFKTMVGQFDEIERTRTFYEQKCFRILGNTYMKFLERNEFDLASLCGSEMNRVGLAALNTNDDQLLDVIIVRFNTTLRFALKHGVRNNEARHLYNVAFHYRNFIESLVKYNKIEHTKRSFQYLRIYGTEVFKYGRTSPSMYFIVDVFAAEMKRILILVYRQNWSLDIQGIMLNEMLKIDSYPDFNQGDVEREQLVNTGVRILQIGLGLFYLRQNRVDFVLHIIADILEDLEFLGEETFRRGIVLTCNRLRLSTPNFWEDTDRGSLNLYYTPDQDQIDPFLRLLYQEMDRKLAQGQG